MSLSLSMNYTSHERLIVGGTMAALDASKRGGDKKMKGEARRWRQKNGWLWCVALLSDVSWLADGPINVPIDEKVRK